MNLEQNKVGNLLNSQQQCRAYFGAVFCYSGANKLTPATELRHLWLINILHGGEHCSFY